MDHFAGIEARYGFPVPEHYRLLHARGHADPDAPDPIWLFEVEWLSPHQIATWRFEPYHRPGYVPFATTPDGDLWCWARDLAGDDGASPVARCPRGYEMCELYAPDFLAFTYRRLLDYADGGFDEPQALDARLHFARWAQDLYPLYPQRWSWTLDAIARRPLTDRGLLAVGEYRTLLRRDLGFPGLGEFMQWLKVE